MKIELREIPVITLTDNRLKWLKNETITRYLEFGSGKQKDIFRNYYEVLSDDEHVGDIKVFYADQADARERRVQILMVIARPNRGIGTLALRRLLDLLKLKFHEAYCVIRKSNIASLKILKRNGFFIDDFDDENLILSRPI